MARRIEHCPDTLKTIIVGYIPNDGIIVPADIFSIPAIHDKLKPLFICISASYFVYLNNGSSPKYRTNLFPVFPGNANLHSEDSAGFPYP